MDALALSWAIFSQINTASISLLRRRFEGQRRNEIAWALNDYQSASGEALFYTLSQFPQPSLSPGSLHMVGNMCQPLLGTSVIDSCMLKSRANPSRLKITTLFKSAALLPAQVLFSNSTDWMSYRFDPITKWYEFVCVCVCVKGGGQRDDAHRNSRISVLY